ncbi:hypothetical protein P879_09774 [Paragonimus westermani]|uniref:Uncharacterized protein n=1 Tax=Paragonimus westermani TaxID=34504 RepID=A0A8T0DFT5_9TREM|nr:hypothetical protein P879_09774 [Paragonimus westermani]
MGKFREHVHNKLCSCRTVNCPINFPCLRIFCNTLHGRRQ